MLEGPNWAPPHGRGARLCGGPSFVPPEAFCPFLSVTFLLVSKNFTGKNSISFSVR
jgi:hypothetical protein